MKLRPVILNQITTRLAAAAGAVTLAVAGLVSAAHGVPPALRLYQNDLVNGVNVEWLKGAANVLAVSATGSGKTVVFSHVISQEPGAVCAIAHRHELVSQISMALARNGVRHKIIGSDVTVRECRANHLDEFGVSYIDQNNRVAVASVDTLVNMDPNNPWCAQVRLWVLDEAHHLLKHNKWGTAVGLFPNARGLGVTAETERADGYGLGRMNDGLFDAMVLAPTMRDLINWGFLTDYKVYAPPSDLDMRALQAAISKSTGDYSPKKLAKITKASHITGDVVAHYLKHAAGKLGITFAADIEHAGQIADAFRQAGVPAEVVSSKTDSARRRQVLRDFRERRILQLVNVDLFGEGFDLPAIEVVSMARATKSFNLYKQQFGRALRLLEGKQWAIIIDHVGNVFEHGLPDKRREFTLGRPVPKQQREPDENVIPMRTCLGCTQPYERVYVACPYCGHEVQPAARSAPEFVDGDLRELDAATLSALRGEADAVMRADPAIPWGAAPIVEASIRKKHYERAKAQGNLRSTMDLWAGWQQHAHGRTPSEIQRLFFLTYGIDALSAQALGATDAESLRVKLQGRLDANGVVSK